MPGLISMKGDTSGFRSKKLTAFGAPVGTVAGIDTVVVARLVVVAVLVSVSVAPPVPCPPLSCPSLFCAPTKRPMKVLISRSRMIPVPPRIFSRLVSEREGWVRAEKKESSLRCDPRLASSGADSESNISPAGWESD